MKKLIKSKWFLILIAPLIGVFGLWSLSSTAGFPLWILLIGLFISCIVSLWHIVDNDVNLLNPKHFFKGKWFLILIGPILGILGLWSVISTGALPLALFVLGFMASCLVSTWHILDNDVVVYDSKLR